MNKDFPIFYFGCWSSVGHYLHNKYGQSTYEETKDCPFTAAELDSKLLTETDSRGSQQNIFPQANEKALVIRWFYRREKKESNYACFWTVISCWDTSVDKRGNSNANFIMAGSYTLKGAMDIAALYFPQITKRLQSFKAYYSESES